ncbi:MAG: alpha-glycosidase [Lachnospiraceae bacterium]|jgi:glycosidase|nr:alpha-glycosidase [Lachnospiraceae bacterium]MCI1397931.1 alpha-glycosidase [Lachnospiraceae bacterium]MCI1424011.1 alpha-glycosidase [Lachnospiraceae bacterium]MCI1452810.1 alpha-glycosidase [Lachnospiraceae bacterium]
MKLEAVRHTGTYPDIYLSDRRTLVVTLRTAKRDAEECRIHYFARTAPEEEKTQTLQFLYRDGLFDYYQGTLCFHQVARYQKYYFELSAGKEIWYLTAEGFRRDPPEDGYFEFLYANRTGIVTLPDWSQGQVFYQIFPERFANGDPSNDPKGVKTWGTIPDRENYMGGDLKGILDHLDHIQELGADCIYLNPIFLGDFNHKYATTDYYRIDPIFGTNDDFRKLVRAVHDRGMKIILDGVFNHSGVHFAPFLDVLKNGEKSEYREWFYPTTFPLDITHHDYECVGAYKYMPKLNTGNPEVRNYFLHVMEYWIREYRIDGWRLDVADEVDEGLWEEARLLLKDRYPDSILIGETWGSGLRLMNGVQMDAIMNYVFRDAVRDFIALETIDAAAFDDRVEKMLSDYPAQMDRAMYLLLDSHDTERFLTLCGGDRRKLKAAAALQMMFVGSPAVYYGDEIAMEGENDPDCRRCMIWDRDLQDSDLERWYRDLIRIRHREPAVRTGAFYADVCRNRSYVFSRTDGQETILTAINAGETEQEVEIPVRRAASYRDLMTGEEFLADPGAPEAARLGDKVRYQGSLMIKMKPFEAKILKED